MSSIPARADLSLVSEALAESLVLAAAAAREARVVSLVSLSATALFTHAVTSAIGAVERRGDVLRRFLSLGPYEGDGPIPRGIADQRVADDEAERAITLLYAHAINCFKGQLAEILALRACTKLLDDLKSSGLVPATAMLLAGDAAKPMLRNRSLKGADMHILHEEDDSLVLHGVAEVKSFVTTSARLAGQLTSHASRACRGLEYVRIDGSRAIRIPCARSGGILRIAASLSDWRLPRGYRFEEENGRSFLHAERLPSIPHDVVSQVDDHTWHVLLGWSHEALSAEAYRLTYWYMEQLGADLFANGSPWPDMTPQQAGANASVQALYYAIRRSRSRPAEQRAIALYNAYGFGYALGTNYKDRSGRRHMLWPQDLHEMLANEPKNREIWIR